MDTPGGNFSGNPASWPWFGRAGLGALSLVIANSAVLMVWFATDVTTFQLLLVYWCECVWIGIASGLKLLAASVFGAPFATKNVEVSAGAALFLSLLSIGLCGGVFFSLSGMILVALLFANDALALSQPGDEPLQNLRLIVIASCLLAAAHLVSFVVNFLVRGEFRAARAGDLLALPFRRSLALFVFIALGIGLMAALPEFASTGTFAVSVIALKLLWDLRLHVRERRAFSAPDRAAGQDLT